MSCRAAQREKALLLGIAWWTITGLILIAICALYLSDKVNSASSTLIGVVVAGLIAMVKDAIQALRAYWQDDRMGKMTDQLASAPPADKPLTPPPPDVAAAAQQTADAAQAEADSIEGKKT